MDTLWGRVRVLARNGQPVYAGLADDGGSPFVLPSETRSLADVMRAVAVATPEGAAVRPAADRAGGLGTGDGWGNTNATAAALQALAASWGPPGEPHPVLITLPDRAVPGMHRRPTHRWCRRSTMRPRDRSA